MKNETKMNMKVRMDNTMRTVSNFTVRFEFSRSFIMVTMLAPRLSKISPSKTTMMIFTLSILPPFALSLASVPESRCLST